LKEKGGMTELSVAKLQIRAQTGLSKAQQNLADCAAA